MSADYAEAIRLIRRHMQPGDTVGKMFLRVAKALEECKTPFASTLSGEEVTEAALPDELRVPLHELQADVDYLIGRVVDDGSCAPMIAASFKEKLAAIETALTA